MDMPLLELKDVTVWRGDRKVFDGLSLQIESQERVAVLGPNGAGKSTLLSLISGDIHPVADEGCCRIFGEDQWSLYDLRERMGLVTVEQLGLFDDDELASDIVLTGLHGVYGMTESQTYTAAERRKAWRAMKQAGVESLIWRDYGDLSSGERRRFLLARSLVHEPEMLILDEPTTSLDLPGSWAFMMAVRGRMREGTGVLLVTHDVGEIAPEIDRVVLMRKGGILADGNKREVLTENALSDCYGMKLRVSWEGDRCEIRPAAGL